MNPPFLMGTTSSITMQSLGKIVQRTPAVGAKMWCLLPARRRPQGLVVIGVCLSVCLSVCLCALCLSARYLKNGFMDHHRIWCVGAGGEPLEQVQFWCWSDSGCISRITFPFPSTLMLATASAQVCVPLGHSSLIFCFVFLFVFLSRSESRVPCVRGVHNSNTHCVAVCRPISTRFAAFFLEGTALSETLHSSHIRC